MPRVRRNADGLNDREQRFAEEYVVDFSPGKAYIRAGFKARNQDVADACGSRLLGRDRVAAVIERLKSKLAEKSGLDAALTMDEHLCMAHVNAEDIWDTSGEDWVLRPAKDVPKRALRAVKSVKTKTTTRKNGDVIRETEITLFDKLTAIATSLKMTGQLKEKYEHSGPDGGAIPVTVIRFNLHGAIPGVSRDTNGTGSGDSADPVPAALESQP